MLNLDWLAGQEQCQSARRQAHRADKKMQKRKGPAKSRCTSQQEAKKITARGECLALVCIVDLRRVQPVDVVEGSGDLFVCCVNSSQYVAQVIKKKTLTSMFLEMRRTNPSLQQSDPWAEPLF